MNAENPETPDSKSESKADKPASDSRFAVYDLTYLKFVGHVTSKRPSKAQAEKAAGHDNVEIREV